jgi:hypothetical protein
MMTFSEAISQLSRDQRLVFYIQLAHELTVTVRMILHDPSFDLDRLDIIKQLNEVQHRVTAKVRVLHLQSHEWSEADSQALLKEAITRVPALGPELLRAIRASHRYALRSEIPSAEQIVI